MKEILRGMRSRLALLFLALFTLTSLAAAWQSRNRFSGAHSISGTVRSGEDRPAADARVEVRDVLTGQLVAAGYCNYSGSFDIEVPNGRYELVVTQGLAETRERVEVAGSPAFVSLRLPAANSGSDVGGPHTVSVAQFKVPGKARGLLKKARSAFEKGKTEESSRYLSAALEIYPAFAEALTLRGILSLDEGKPDQARQDLENAIAADSSYALAYVVLGANYNLLSRFDDALRTLDHGVALAPNSWQGYFEMGKAFIGKANYPAALRQLNKAEEMAPRSYPLIHLVKAHTLLAMQSYPEAMEELQAYLDGAPKGPKSDEARAMLEKVRAFSASKN